MKYDLIVVKEIDNIEAAIEEAKKAEAVTNVYARTKVSKVVLNNNIIYDSGYYNYKYIYGLLWTAIYEQRMYIYVDGYENRVDVTHKEDKIIFDTKDADKVLFEGKITKKGEVSFWINERSLIADGSTEGEFVIRGDSNFTIRLERSYK